MAKPSSRATPQRTMLEDVVEPLNVLYAGEGGTGKTTGLAAMANLGRTVMVNAESGIKARALRQRGIDTSSIELWPPPGERITFEGLEDLHLELQERIEEGGPDAPVGVAWDSITEIHKALLEQVVMDAVRKADRAGKERDRFFIERGDYGVMTEQVRQLFRRYRDLPCHFGASALLRREQDDDGTVTYNPAITPALQNDVIGWVDLVCVTMVSQVDGEEEYRGLFRPHGTRRGKDRLGAMPKWLVDPTFDRLVAYVDGELDRDSDPVMKAARERAARAKAKEIDTDTSVSDES